MTIQIDVGGWPDCSGASVTLYLIPAAGENGGRPRVYSFGSVGPGLSEFSQAEFEAIEVRTAATREAFLSAVSNDATPARLLAELHELEALAIDARRARREAETAQGGGA